MKIAIIDDEKMWLQAEKNIIEKYYKKENIQIDMYYTGKKFLESGELYDVILMDIELGEGKEDGFRVAEKYQKIKEDVILIIMTTHTEFSRKGYYVNAFRYIDKTCMKLELKEALEAIEKRRQKDYVIEIPISRIGVQKISCKKIVYIEANNNLVDIHMSYEKLPCLQKIRNLNEELKNKGFFMVHRAYIVNLEWIQKFSSESIFMKNGEVIPISRRRYKEFKIIYFQWKMERANG